MRRLSEAAVSNFNFHLYFAASSAIVMCWSQFPLRGNLLFVCSVEAHTHPDSYTNVSKLVIGCVEY